LDVGQGDAAVIFGPDQRAHLIDMGPDSVEMKVFLDDAGLDTIHTAIITHADFDHYGALKTVMNKCIVKRVVLPKDEQNDKTWLELLAFLKENEVYTDTLFFGDTLTLGPQAWLSVLWPIRTSMLTGNNQSYVLHLHYEKSRVLFAGDIEEEAEYEILKINPDLFSQIYKVPHHGSRSSASLPFISQVSPDWAVISCDSSVYGHPHEQIVNGLKMVMEDTTRILRTDRLGDLEFHIFPERIEYLGTIQQQ
jgi:competence protein ComEC